MSLNCNKIYFCLTIKNGLRSSGKPREKEVRAKDRRWEERNRTNNEEKKMGFTLLLHNWIFLSQLAWCMHSIAQCLSAIKVWFSLSIIVQKYQSLAPSGARNIESCVCLALELKSWLKIQIILIFITFWFFSMIFFIVFGIDAWKYWAFVMLFFKHIWPLYDYDFLSLVQSLI